MKSLQRIAQAFLMGSFMAVLWLVSAIENGAGGTGVMYSIAGIVLIWVFLIGYESWRERDKSRREMWHCSRSADSVQNEIAKQKYLQNIFAA